MENNGKMISVRLDESLVNEIDELASIVRLNRTQLIRNMLLMGVEDARLMRKMGLLHLASKGMDLMDFIKKSLVNNRYKLDENNLTIPLK